MAGDSSLFRHVPVWLWTRRCRGNCGHTGPHSDHLTWFGRKALGIGEKS